MAKKPKKIKQEEDYSFLDLVSAAGISLEHIESPLIQSKYKEVKKALCGYRGFVRILRDEESVNRYFDIILRNGVVALDTETNNSLDVHDNKIVGLCLYTPFSRPVYIPLQHRDKKTGELVDGQVSMDFIKQKIELLLNIRIIFHNAKFDINVIRKNFGIHLKLYWDTLIAAKILDENRFENGLKSLYSEIDPTIKAYHVTTFFEDNETADIEDFGLYSAMDSYETYCLYKKQEKELSTPSMAKLKNLLHNLEFRVTEVCADMEWRGFNFSEDICKNFKKTENDKLAELGERINKLLEPYKDKILAWEFVKGGRGKVIQYDKKTGEMLTEMKEVEDPDTGKKTRKSVPKYGPDPYAGKRIDWPVLLTSADQVLALLNCVLGITVPSSTVDQLKATGNEIADLIGKYRHINHNLTSFYSPYLELSKEGRIYATFNQMGEEEKTVKTGRFSSKEPNLQQLPARQGEDGVRLMFSASPGKVLCDNDFSAQEPRVMSSLCGERELIDGYNLRTPEFPKGRDFYAMLASTAFKMDYWNCVEFDKEGKYQAEGKARRQVGKVIQLGVSYGMGVPKLVREINKKRKAGEQMTMEEGEKMMNDFFGKFRTLKTWKDYNMARLQQFGYMETAMGRRRRLFDTWLPDYDVKIYTYTEVEDIFFGMDRDLKIVDVERTNQIFKKLNDPNFNSFKKKEFIEELRVDSLNVIESNGGFKARPKTQATNFIIQGGGAELTKKAMVGLYHHPDKERLGIEIVAPVHDEILIEAYTEHRKEALQVLASVMAGTAEGVYEVKMAGDGVIEQCWNLGHFKDKIQKEYKKLIEKESEDEAIQSILDSYKEFDSDCLVRMIRDEFDEETDRIIPRKGVA